MFNSPFWNIQWQVCLRDKYISRHIFTQRAFQKQIEKLGDLQFEDFLEKQSENEKTLNIHFQNVSCSTKSMVFQTKNS